MKTRQELILCSIALLCFGLVHSLRADDQTGQKPGSSGERYGQHRQGQESQEGQEMNAPGQPTRFNKASSLIGMEVQNPQGEKLGDIKDIVIDFQQGKVSYVVLGSGGILGVNEKLLAVPVAAFKRGPDQRHLVLQASKENINQARGFGDDWPSVQNPSFGAIPFWEKSGRSSQKSGSKTSGQPEQ